MKTLFVILLGSLIAGTNAHAWKETGGGDEVALDFQRAFAGAIRAVQDGKITGGFTADQLLQIAQQTKVMVVEERLTVQSGGIAQESIAVNEPAESLVRINRARWNAVKDARLKEAVALHEMLSLLRVERTGYYEFSAKYLEKFGLSPWAISGGEQNKAKDPQPRRLSCRIDYYADYSQGKFPERLEFAIVSKETPSRPIRALEAKATVKTQDGLFEISGWGISTFANAVIPRPFEYTGIKIKDLRKGTFSITGPTANWQPKEANYFATASYSPAVNSEDISTQMINVDCSFD